MAIGVEALSGVCFFVLTGAHHILASKDGCDAPALSAANVRRSHKFPVQALLCIAYNLAAAAQSLCFSSKLPPNSLQTPSRYSCHIYSQHTLPCSITGANPLLHSLLCQLRRACITPLYCPSNSTRSNCVTEPPFSTTLPTIYQHATNNTANTRLT